MLADWQLDRITRANARGKNRDELVKLLAHSCDLDAIETNASIDRNVESGDLFFDKQGRLQDIRYIHDINV